MNTFNVSLTLEEVRVIQEALEDKLDTYHEAIEMPDEEVKVQAVVVEYLFTEVFGPIIVSCRNI